MLYKNNNSNNSPTNTNNNNNELKSKHSMDISTTTITTTNTSSSARSINSLNYSPDRLEDLLNNTQLNLLLPMISLPNNQMYWIDGWSPSNYNNQTMNQQEYLINTNDLNMQIMLKNCLNNICYKSESLMDKDHFDFYGCDYNNMPLILSYRIDNENNIKVIFRYVSLFQVFNSFILRG